MRQTRKTVKRYVESSDSEDDIPLKKLHLSNNPSRSYQADHEKKNDSSSSESDIESYLQPIHKIDLNSSFFNTRTNNEEEFNKIENNLFAGITRLSDTDSDENTNKSNYPLRNSKQNLKEVENVNKPSTSGTKLNFQHLQEFTRQIEEAKKEIEKYNAKKKVCKKVEENNMDISVLLAAGESKQISIEDIKPEDLHSSDFESCDSDQNDWEEIKDKDSQEVRENNSIPKRDLQIVVDMPGSCKRKKGVDLLAAMKRRLNRIRKENQVYVHKVHLLCWLAHGNYVNECVNNTEVLCSALSLLPSDKCYPSDRTDLNYLEQIVKWYKKNVNIVEKPDIKKLDLVDFLKLQISKKEAYNENTLVYIFIGILRALGIQCRLVLSFQIEPLRPPTTDLHSLAKDNTMIKNETKNKKSRDKLPIKKDTQQSKVAKPRTEEKNLVTKESGDKKEKSKVENDVSKKRKASKKQLKEKVETNLNEIHVKKDVEPNRDKKSNTLDFKKTKRDLSKGKDDRVNERQNTTENDKKKQKESIKKHTEIRKNHNKEKVTHSETNNSTKKELIKIKFPRKNKSKTVPQIDGLNSSSDDTAQDLIILQLDGANDKEKSSTSKRKNLRPLNTVEDSTLKKPNLKKLNTTEDRCKLRKHPSRLKSLNTDYNSEDDFRPRSPFANKNTDSPKLSQSRKVNLQKLKNTSQKSKSPPTPKKQLDVKNDIINLIKGRITEQKHIDISRKVKKRKSQSNDTDSDSDFMPETMKKKHHDSNSDIDYFVSKPKVKQRIRLPRKVSDENSSNINSDSEKTGKKKGNNVWAEVFLEAEEKWISVDVVRGQIHCVNQLYTRAAHPVSYIVAWNNNNNIKDVTKRYCSNFNTITRKLRIDAKWWDETMKPFLGTYTARDKEEDDDLNRQQLDQPLPKSITEYKNHPLYALRRHLLKFEDIYPPNIQPMGYIRGEAVYPRNCVYVCRSRDIWLKEAKVVKPGEKPYKIVKARPKYDKLSNQVITGQLLEIFGEWQTTDYEPPTAENGVVPRNAFGNVELFKSCMLPKGTVHLKLPGLNKVCRRMNIDCAPAIVGFDFHGGWSHPTYDGFVVCEEFAESVVMAWELEQEEIERKENEKIEKRVYGNWKRLIKGLLIRERLKAKYDFGQPSTSGHEKEKQPKGPRFCTKKR